MATMKGKRILTSAYLDPVKADALKRLSAASGRPVAEHMREGVDLVLAKYKVPVAMPKVARAKK
jgi:hypothetical protein